MTDIKPIKPHHDAPLMVVVELREGHDPQTDWISFSPFEKDLQDAMQARYGVHVPVYIVLHGTKVHAIPCPAGEKNEALEALRDLYDEAALPVTDTRPTIAEYMEEVSGMWLAKVTGYAGDNEPAQVGSWSGMAVAYGKVAETARREGWVRTK